MSKKEKLLQKIENNPKDVRFEDLCKLLEWNEWIVTSQTSSHYTYSKKGYGRVTIVKHGKKQVKSVYVKEVLKRIGG